MNLHKKLIFVFLSVVTRLISYVIPDFRNLKDNKAIDEKLKKFLPGHFGQWHDMNISEYIDTLLADTHVPVKEMKTSYK